MKWQKTLITKEALQPMVENMTKSIKAGDPLIEKMRCVYTLEDDPIVRCLMPYDFIDKFVLGLKIKNLYLYQASET